MDEINAIVADEVIVLEPNVTSSEGEQKQTESTPSVESSVVEPSQPEPDWKARATELEQTLIRRTAEVKATALGVPQNRLKQVLRLADLDTIDTSRSDTETQIHAAVEAVVNDMPELIPAPHGTGSRGAFVRKASTTPEETERAAFAAALNRQGGIHGAQHH